MGNDENSRGIVRKHIVFYGRVQGVGFRWTARYAAESFGVTGWVRNLYDGSVEMEAEGTEESIGQMIISIENARYIAVEDITMKTIPAEGSRSFEIR